jgi:hypothetical protein
MFRVFRAVALVAIAACSATPSSPSTPASHGSGAGSAGHADAAEGPSSSVDAGTNTGASSGDGGGVNPTDAGGNQFVASDAGPGAKAFTLPPLNQGLDYQLGGAYTPPAGVKIVSRDRTASVAAGLYNICYVNGFQIQPDEEGTWMSDHPDLILRNAAQQPVIDQDWNEMLIDVSTQAKRVAVAEIVGAWIKGCAAAGFDAVEIDNLDSFSRSNGQLTEDDAVSTMSLFSAAAHAQGLAIAQKNSAELVARRSELGTDFVVAEECNRYAECDVYTAAYGDHVLVIEYRRADFDKGCANFPNLSIVLRDLDLVDPSGANYTYDGC